MTDPTPVSWKAAWHNPLFRKKLLVGLLVMAVILVSFHPFFVWAQQREGNTLHDALLSWLPARNVSVAIFILLWSASLLITYWSIRRPMVFLVFLWGFILLSVCRFISISCVPLEPPMALIPLQDPLANSFYGKNFITKDLFFSGHTATQFLIAFCVPVNKYRWIVFASAMAVGILVLVQHVHYTVDVLAAPLFTFGIYHLARYIVKT